MVRATALLLLCWSALVAAAVEQPAAPAAGDSPEAGKQPLSLTDCIALARCTHEDVLIAAQRIREARAGVDGAEAAWYPSADVSGTWRIGDRTVGTTGTGTLTQDLEDSDVALNLSWAVFDARRPKLIEKARRLEDQARAGALGTLRDLDLSVATAYIDLVRAEKLAALQDETLAMDSELLRIATARERIGDGTSLETVQAEAQVALATQQVLAARNAVEKARLSLLSAMGLSEDTGYAFALEAPPGDVATPPLPECLDRAYDTRDDIASIQRALDISRVDVSLARLARRVSLQVNASGYNSLTQRTDSASSYQLAFTATLPIFDGGAAKSQLRSAEARRIISEAEVGAALRKVWLEVTGSYRDIESAREQVVASGFSEAAAQRSLDKTRTAFGIGLSSFSDTLNAALQQYQARQQVIEAEATLFRAYWALHRAAPGIVSGLTPLVEPTTDAPARRDVPAPREGAKP